MQSKSLHTFKGKQNEQKWKLKKDFGAGWHRKRGWMAKTKGWQHKQKITAIQKNHESAFKVLYTFHSTQVGMVYETSNRRQSPRANRHQLAWST